MRKTSTVMVDQKNFPEHKGFHITSGNADILASDKSKSSENLPFIKVWWPSVDKKNMLILKKALEQENFKDSIILSAGLPMEGDDNFPDIAVVDLDQYNIEMIKITRTFHPNLPIITTGFSESRTFAEEIFSTGAADYLVKPVKTEFIAEIIAETCSLRQISKKLPDEKRVMGVMVPIMEYTVLKGKQTVNDAIEAIKASFRIRETTGRFLDTVHRSVLVMDEDGGVEGIITVRNLISIMIPDYLADMSEDEKRVLMHSKIFWKGRFSTRLKKLTYITLREIMSPPPPQIDACATLMEATLKMLELKTRRLVVVQNQEVIGIIREQDLFFEMEKILRRKPSVPVTIKKN